MTLMCVDAEEPGGRAVGDCQLRAVTVRLRRGEVDDRLRRESGQRTGPGSSTASFVWRWQASPFPRELTPVGWMFHLADGPISKGTYSYPAMTFGGDLGPTAVRAEDPPFCGRGRRRCSQDRRNAARPPAMRPQRRLPKPSPGTGSSDWLWEESRVGSSCEATEGTPSSPALQPR